MASSAPGPSICEGCTVWPGIIASEEAFDTTDKSMRALMTRANIRIAKVALDKAAEQVDCKMIYKELPAIPDEMPVSGTPEALELAMACPALSAYADIAQQLAQEQADKLTDAPKE